MSKTLAQFIGGVEVQAVELLGDPTRHVEFYQKILDKDKDLRGLPAEDQHRAKNYLLRRINNIKAAWSRDPRDPFYYEDREPGS